MNIDKLLAKIDQLESKLISRIETPGMTKTDIRRDAQDTITNLRIYIRKQTGTIDPADESIAVDHFQTLNLKGSNHV